MAEFKNLGDLINRDRDMAKLAVIDLGGEETPCEYCYAELDAMTMGVARGLARRGFARGDRIAILSANRVEFIAAYFGIMRAGLVAVPVNYRFPKKTIDFIIQRCRRQARVLRSRQPSRTVRTDLPAVVFGHEDRDGFDRFVDPGEFETVIPEPREPAMFLYTSGSTGVPKGVVLSHQSHIWVVETRLDARSRAASLSDRRAALSHERAGAGQARLRGARDHRAAAAGSRRRTTSRRSANTARPGSRRCRR